MLKALLQGKPLGHPLHPALVHSPIGLLLFSLLFDLGAGLLPAGQSLARAAYYAIAFGVGMGLLAATAGLADWSDIRADHPAKKTATTHMVLNIAGLALFGLNLFLRSGQPDQAASILHLVLSLLGIGVILVSGYLGGTMVYDDGIGAGRHRRETPTPRETIHVSSKEARDGWVYVAKADALEEGETLRVDWDGNVMAIVRLGDKVYAFQEFCTHRYGPLSEGSIQDHQVECPWHRSCFDVRSGKVTDGPAKVDLKTYPASIREGSIVLAAKKK